MPEQDHLASVTVEGHRVNYVSYGADGPTVVLLHALLMTRRFHEPLAEALAARGMRAVAMDLLGTVDVGQYNPADYGTDRLGARLVGILDELGIERCVLGGASIGSVTAMEAILADHAPERVVGLLAEAPFMEHGTAAARPILSGAQGLFTVGARPIARLARILGPMPRRHHPLLNVALDPVAQDPRRSVAFLRGFAAGRKFPPPEERRTITQPTLVIGIPGDPLHPMADAKTLCDDLPNAWMTRGKTIVGLRRKPESLAGEIGRFVESSWNGTYA
jgi:pimeloyl-ACP methyl ester carboxylesterase